MKPYTLIQADCRRIPLGDSSVHFCMTSPPYWALRSYLPSDHALKSAEIGSEATPAQYIENLMVVFDEVRRVLRDDGVCVVNLGETWNASPTGNKKPMSKSGLNGAQTSASYRERLEDTQQRQQEHRGLVKGLKPLDVVGIPYLFALAMRERGWYWRDTVVWRKPSAMPNSVNGWRWQRCRVKVKSRGKSQSPAVWSYCPGCEKCIPNGGYVLRKGALRTTTAHEYCFIFSKSPRYYSDREGWATPAKASTIERNKYSRVLDDPAEQFAVKHDHEFTGTTANLRSVLTVGAEPMRHKHYAAYPTKLVLPFLKAFTSAKGVCPCCGAPWARVVDAPFCGDMNPKVAEKVNRMGWSGPEHAAWRKENPIVLKGWRPTCGCPDHHPIPAIVFDPFSGTGRTGVAAVLEGRRYVGTELNEDYIAIAREQLDEAVQRARHPSRLKPKRQPKPANEMTLFGAAT